MSLIYIEQLLKTCEEMLFSIALPEEIVSKYEHIRQEYLFRAGISWPSRIRFLQQEAYLKLKSHSDIGQPDSLVRQLRNQLDVASASFHSIQNKISYILKKAIAPHIEVQVFEDNERYLMDYINKFQKQERQIYQSLDQLQDLLIQFEKENKILKQDIQQHQQNYNLNKHGVQKELEMKDIKIKEINEDLKESQIQQMKAQDDLEQFRSESLQNLQTLQNELNNLQYQIQMLENERQELTTYNFSLENNLKIIQQERDDLEQQCQEQSKYLTQSQKVEQQLKQELDSIKIQQQQMINEIERQHESEINKLKFSFPSTGHEKNIKNLSDSSEIEHLRNMLRQTRKENANLLDQLGQVSNQHGKEIQKIEQSLEPLKHIWSKFKTTDLQKEIEKLKKELEDLPSQLAESLAQSQCLAFQAEKLNEDNQWLVDRLTEFGKENEMLRSQFQSKNEEYEEENQDNYREQQKKQLKPQQRQKSPSAQQSYKQNICSQQISNEISFPPNKNSPSFGVDIRKQINDQIQHSKQMSREWEEARDELLKQLEDREDIAEKYKITKDT